MKQTPVSARYAKALFLVTERRGETARALEDLEALARVLEPGSRVAMALSSPEIRLADKREAVRRATEGKAVRVVSLFLDLLLRKKRLVELPAIVAEFRALVERAQGIQRVHAVSAVPFLPAQIERLTRELERYTGKQVRLTTEVDSGLIGGALVHIGDRVIDRSVRTLLQSMEKQLEEVGV